MLNLELNNKFDIYKTIADYKYDIYIWGTGSVAAGVQRELEKRNINFSGFFNNVPNYNCDSRISGHSIFTLDELLKTNKKFSVIVGHSHYELANTLKRYKNIDKVWTLSMIVRQDIEMDKNFILNNIKSFEYTYNKLSDNESKINMQNFLNVQLTKDSSYIVDNFKNTCSYFNNDIVSFGNNETYLDIGSYDGSSIDSFINAVDNRYEKIIGLEVMPNAFEKLKTKYTDNRISIINTGISDHIGYDNFNFNDQSTCLATSKEEGTPVKVNTVDNICNKYNYSPTIIKMCIGNTIIPILNGAHDTLKKLPTMIITAGIDKEALIKYIKYIENIVGEGKYEYYLRYTSAMAECLIYIIKPKNRNITK